jgi:hypothetical protein
VQSVMHVAHHATKNTMMVREASVRGYEGEPPERASVSSGSPYRSIGAAARKPRIGSTTTSCTKISLASYFQEDGTRLRRSNGSDSLYHCVMTMRVRGTIEKRGGRRNTHDVNIPHDARGNSIAKHFIECNAFKGSNVPTALVLMLPVSGTP